MHNETNETQPDNSKESWNIMKAVNLTKDNHPQIRIKLSNHLPKL